MVEKLGIAPLKVEKTDFVNEIYPTAYVDPTAAEEIERQRNEMLEVLIDCAGVMFSNNTVLKSAIQKIAIVKIEKATGRTWAEVKELIEDTAGRQEEE